MAELVVNLVVLIGTILCFYHCWMYRGQWQAIGFFGGGFIFGVIRENLIALIPGMYSYSPEHVLFLGAAPFIMWIGWSVSIYASWAVAERLIEAFISQWRDNTWTVPLIAALITALLSLPVEVTAGAPETLWWEWPVTAIPVLYEMPPLVPFGWGGAAWLFLHFFMMNEQKSEKEPQQRALVFMVLSLLIVVLHLVYTFIVRFLILLIMQPA